MYNETALALWDAQRDWIRYLATEVTYGGRSKGKFV